MSASRSLSLSGDSVSTKRQPKRSSKDGERAMFLHCKCLTSSNKKLVETSASLLVTKGIATRSKKLLVAPGITTSNKKLLVTSIFPPTSVSLPCVFRDGWGP